MNEGKLTDLVMERKDIPPMAKIILRAIIRRVDWKTWSSKDGHKTVSTRELARKCGTSQATVWRSIARLEKAKLIERDVFKATRTQAPPIKVMVETIMEGDLKMQSPKKEVTKKCSQGVTAKVSQGVTKECSQGVTKKCNEPDLKMQSLSIETIDNTIINTINNTSVVGGEWGVNSDELWGDDLRNSLNVIPVRKDDK